MVPVWVPVHPRPRHAVVGAGSLWPSYEDYKAVHP